MTTRVEIERAHWDDPRVVRFRELMDAEVQPLYADLRDEIPRVVVDPATILATLVATVDGEAVGTAALKQSGPFVEVKRVFVLEKGRRLGVARALMAAAEREAEALGVRELFLQTGKRQEQAMALYEREGWLPVAPYGPFEGDTTLSRCYVKPLARPFVAGVVAAETPRGDDAVGRVLGEIEALDAAGADLAIIEDDPVPPAGSATLDAPMVAAAAAATTTHVALAPRVRVTHTEPFHVSKGIQTLDWAAAGRAGWVVGVSLTDEEARAFGRRPAPAEDEAWQEAEAVIDASRRLWDSWEDGAEIRDVATGRFIDRDRVHYVDVETRWFSIKGPSIVPRSPQGQIPVIVDVAGDGPALAAAAREADVVRVAGDRPRELAARVRAAAEAEGRRVAILVEVDPERVVRAPHARSDEEQLAAWAAFLRAEAGADGVVVTGSADAVRAIAGDQHAAGTTLRERLGLARPASRYEAAPELVSAAAEGESR